MKPKDGTRKLLIYYWFLNTEEWTYFHSDNIVIEGNVSNAVLIRNPGFFLDFVENVLLESRVGLRQKWHL